MKLEIKKKLLSKKWIIILVLIPFVSIFLVIIFRHTYILTNEEIIDYVKNAKSYSSRVEYTIKNSRGEYKEDTDIYYCKDEGMRIDFEKNRVKIYKDGFISIKDNGYEYELNGDFDQVYPLAFESNLLSNEVTSIKEGTEEWGETKYLEVDINLPFKNNHMTSAKLYIDKDNKSPIVAKIYDMKGNERVIIVYKDFKYLSEMDKSLF